MVCPAELKYFALQPTRHGCVSCGNGHPAQPEDRKQVGIKMSKIWFTTGYSSFATIYQCRKYRATRHDGAFEFIGALFELATLEFAARPGRWARK